MATDSRCSCTGAISMRWPLRLSLLLLLVSSSSAAAGPAFVPLPHAPQRTYLGGVPHTDRQA